MSLIPVALDHRLDEVAEGRGGQGGGTQDQALPDVAVQQLGQADSPAARQKTADPARPSRSSSG